MSFVAVDGASVFAVGAVAKSAPLIQTDLNVDQLAATMSEGLSGSSEDFETGDFSAHPWILFQPNAWAITTTTPHAGTFAIKAGLNPINTTSTIQVTKIVSAGTFSFWYKIDSGTNADLFFFIDGVNKFASSINVGWTQFTIAVTAGSHLFRWMFIQRTLFGASDAVWIDDIFFPGQATGGVSDLHRHTGGDGGKPVRRWPMNPNGKSFGSGDIRSKTHGLWRLYSTTFQRTIDTLGVTIEEVAQVSDGFWIPNGVKGLNLLSRLERPPSGTTYNVKIGLALYDDTIANPYDLSHYTNESERFNFTRQPPFDIPIVIDPALYGQFVRLGILLDVRTTAGISTFFFWDTLTFEHQHRFTI